MMNIQVEWDDKAVLNYLIKAERRLDKGMSNVTKKVGDIAMYRAMAIAPYRTGALRSSITKEILSDTPELKEVKITTSADPDQERAESFGKGKNAKENWVTFVNWLHNSRYAQLLNWHGNVPDFLTNDAIYTDLEEKYKVMIIQEINQAYEVK